MSLLNLLGIGDAFAEAATGTAAATPQNSLLSMLPMLIIFVLVFYFLLVRPQTKRAKEHRQLMDNLAKDDEVVTTGGLTGKIVEINEGFIVLEVAKSVQVTFQKNAIAMVLPKGTLKSL